MELGQLVDEAKLADIPVLVYGNKSDLMNAMEQCEIEESVAPVLKGRNYFVVECSAKTGKGLQDGAEWLVDQINKGVGSLGVPCLTFPPLTIELRRASMAYKKRAHGHGGNDVGKFTATRARPAARSS